MNCPSESFTNSPDPGHMLMAKILLCHLQVTFRSVQIRHSIIFLDQNPSSKVLSIASRALSGICSLCPCFGQQEKNALSATSCTGVVQAFSLRK